MRSDTKQNVSITQALLQDLMDREKINSAIRNPSLGSKPVEAPALYDDAGNGYNSNFVFPQD